MKALRLLVLLLVLATHGCSSANRTISIKLVGKSLPHPAFKVTDPSKVGQTAEYSRITMYEVNQCKIPRCPIVWRATIAHDYCPKLLLYDGVPVIGAVIVTKAHRLKRNGTYRLILDQEPGMSSRDWGAITFRADRHGRLSVVDD